MNDKETTLQELKDIIQKFINERDWKQFHSPKNVSANLSIEASELLEHFVWSDSKESFQDVEKHREDIEDEAADILYNILEFANVCNIDIAKALERKMEKNRKKYPIEKSKGKKLKYTEL